ncbi:hypothetical protein JR316_0009527 [Psilocybe cubensis]|uniref:Uncharacterized protein n=2 Tax=Psilocybe cubensis TaxID=181762 RepID=A0ACB8GNV4_PSICU|nr:hypothetical protein JR316_0009527 [Psilocybe cubensis]KAH9477323.1 hypothetical protein JR316_0009527 [Psilocybe cubensis]
MHATSSQIMQYPMCSGNELRRISSDYVERLAARSEILNDVVDQFLTTALTQREYTRSVAYTIVLMLNSFHKQNPNKNLGKALWQKFCGDVVSYFENYDWKNANEGNGNDPETGLVSIDALALCALVGDLTSLKLISYHRFKNMTRLLVRQVETCLHVECIHTLFSHAAARATPEIHPVFLFECIRTVKKRISHATGPIHRFPEEVINFETFVRHHLIKRQAAEFPSFHDKRLNLEDALMASCANLSVWRCFGLVNEVQQYHE